MTPDYRIEANGTDITGLIQERLLSLTVTDEAGFKSDTVEIVLDDRDTLLELPKPGATLIIYMGYVETGLMAMGTFTADEVQLKGPPDTLTIRGGAASLGDTLKEQKTREWDDKTLNEIVATLAGEHGLAHKVSEALQSVVFDYLAQTDESDVNFLTRIARDLDAIATVKGDTMLVLGKGEGRSVSGQELPPQTITRTGKLNWSATLATNENFKSVEASWHNTETGARATEREGKEGPVKKLRHIYPDKEKAKSAAKAKLSELKRGTDTLRITQTGNPQLAAEMRINADGFRQGINGLWSITSVKHQINDRGFITSIETEKPKEGESET